MVTAGEVEVTQPRRSSGGLLRGSMTYGSVDVAQRVIGFLLLPVFARQLDPADFGLLGLTYTLTGLLGAVFSLGISQAIVRFSAGLGATERRRFLSGTWILLVLFAAVGAIVLGGLGEGFWRSVLSKLPYRPFVLLALVSAFSNVAVLDVRLAIYRAMDQPRPYLIISGCKLVLANGLSLLLVLGYGRGARGIIEGQTVAAVAVALVALVSLAREVGFSWSREAASRSLRFGVPLAPRALSAWSLRMSDRLVLDRQVGLADIGAYTVANQVSSSFQMLVTGLNLALAPTIARIGGLPDRAERMRQTLHDAIAALVVGGVFLCLAARPVVDVLLPGTYDGVAGLLPYLFAGAIASGVVVVLTQAIVFGEGRTSGVMLLGTSSAILNLALTLLLVPSLGVRGAAISTLAAYLGMVVGAYLLQRRAGWVQPEGIVAPGVVGTAGLVGGWLLQPGQVVVDGLIAVAVGAVVWMIVRRWAGRPLDPRL